jgi:hypothetical protein
MVMPCHAVKLLPEVDDPKFRNAEARMFCANHSVYWKLGMLEEKLDWCVKQTSSVLEEYEKELEIAIGLEKKDEKDKKEEDEE